MTDLFSAAEAATTDAHVTLTAMSPIHHGSFAASGNAALLRRLPLVSLEGMPRIPAISGNSLRGIARRQTFRELFERAGLSREAFGDGGEVMWDRLYAALANGGHLDGSERVVNPSEMRQLREDLPPLSVFGAALYSFMLAGHSEVGMGWLVCQESIAAGVVRDPGAAAPMAEEMVEDHSQARHIDREQHDPDLSGVTPMPTTMEVIGTGARLESLVTFARHATREERGALLWGISQIQVIGGKGTAGLGRVAVVIEGPEVEADIAAYRAWIDGAAGLEKTLRSLALKLASKGKKKGKK